MSDKIYSIVTEKILEALDRGVVPWRKPWSAAGLPRNGESNRPYSGINSVLLSLSEYPDPRWLTWKQIQKRGGHVHKGAKSTLVVFVSDLKVQDRDNPDETKRIHFLKYYRLFNVAQADGLDFPPLETRTTAIDPIAEAEAIVAAMPNPPRIDHNGGSQAFYRPKADTISLPSLDSFESAESYAATKFHELRHSTGHHSRLDRESLTGLAPFGSPVYSKEELIAEFGGAFLSGQAGISPATLDNSAAYIDSWKKVLKADTRLVVQAASAGQRAADFILAVGV